MSNLVLHLNLAPPPSGEDVERIEDLIASALWRHGWRGALTSDTTGNTVVLKYAPVDDGRGYPRADGVTRGELAHALRRVLAYAAIHDSAYYTTNADALKARALLERLGDRDDARAGEREFSFAYRDGEIAATVRAASSDAAWEKLTRVVGGVNEPGVTLAVGDAMLHTCFWTETTEESGDPADAYDDDGELWNVEPPDAIIDRSDDWTGCASADSVEI